MKNVIGRSWALPVLLLWNCTPGAPEATDETSVQAEFFTNLAAHCGNAYLGETTYPTDVDNSMVGATLQMHVRDCSPNQLRIPFLVDEDRSRTWILTLDGEALILKHDHRMPDGSPDELTDYGGVAAPGGTPWRQSFPADEFTKELLPEAATNVWTLEIDPEGERFIYDLQRHGQPRYRAVFDLSQPVAPPE